MRTSAELREGFLSFFESKGHKRHPSGSLVPRRRLKAPPRSRNRSRPSKVALTTLWGFVVPSDLVSTSVIPADSTTARTAPPAMMPVPAGAERLLRVLLIGTTPWSPRMACLIPRRRR
jgi:hypothetical protein